MKSLFNLPSRSSKAGDLNLIKKVSRPKKSAVLSVKGSGLLGQLNTAIALVEKNLGHLADEFILIRTKQDLHRYITASIVFGKISIDTETTGLDPLINKIVGICIYTPGEKAAYIPMRHKSYVTQDYVDDQLSPEEVKEEFDRLVENNTEIIMFNAKFDIRMLFCDLGISLTPTYCGYIASRLINELEPEANLKALYNKYVVNTDKKGMKFSNFFEGIAFDSVPIKYAYLYAANDAKITYDVYESQMAIMTRPDMKGVLNVFRTIEIPLIPCICEMENTGVCFDPKTCAELSEKYNKLLLEAENKVYEAINKYERAISKYRNSQGVACKLDNPINLNSPPQLSILFYDIIGVKVVDKKKPRTTGAKALALMNLDVSDLLLEYRGLAKLVSTYIDKMPKIVNPHTGRIHASLNQIGADTGRTSSSDPNMQNIPSKNKDIRKMFVATKGYCLLSSDYSAQEPRIIAHLARDKTMIQGYRDGLDVYVLVASIVFDLSYSDCCEFKEDGITTNPEGKKRRSVAKAIVLGVAYGKQIPAIAKDLNITEKKAKEVYDKIMEAFPGLPRLLQESRDFALANGYVETIWGRRRRLPDLLLDRFTFEYDNKHQDKYFDPFFDGDEPLSVEVPEDVKHAYLRRLNKEKYSGNRRRIIEAARSEGIIIRDNTEKIAQAERQLVNSRVQGSAADQTKKAMYLVFTNKKLRELKFRLLLNVHDELIGECPEESVKECAVLMSKCMEEAAKDLVVPSHCDVEVTRRWFGEKIA